jgi:hypothetical protein
MFLGRITAFIPHAEPLSMKEPRGCEPGGVSSDREAVIKGQEFGTFHWQFLGYYTGNSHMWRGF